MKFDSQEEFHFNNWLEEGVGNGFIEPEFTHHKAVFELSPRQTCDTYTKTGKRKDKFLFHAHTYKPDFVFTVTNKFIQAFPKLKWDFGDGNKIYADIKGGWTKGDETKCLNITRKWLYQDCSVYIEVIKVGGRAPKNNIFLSTWCPESAYFTPKKHDPVRKYIGGSRISDFL